LFTGGSHPRRTVLVDPSLARRKATRDACVAAASKKRRLEERKKKSLFANIADFKRLSKQEYRKFHE
jgi:hypothetical protein